MEQRLELSEKTAIRKLDYMLHMHEKNRLIVYLDSQQGRSLFWNRFLYQLPSLLKQISCITPRNDDDLEIIELVKAAASQDILRELQKI